jgi:ABC transporter substrate binding protein (PQQ-dependent alcohol dehydrogenase system)
MLRGLLLGALCVLTIIAFASGSDAADKASADATPSQTTINIAYLGKAYNEPPHLSLMDKVLPDEGIAGARLGTQDDNRTGSFLGKKFVLTEDIIPATGDVVAKAKQILAQGPTIIIADLKAPDLLAVADLTEAHNALIFNIRSNDDALRQENCRANLFHIIPDWAMRADALAQYLVWKKWQHWFILKGTLPSDQEYIADVEHAAGRFGGKIV